MFTNPTWGKHDNMTLFYPQKKSLAISGTDVLEVPIPYIRPIV